jgi:hypothetical protein
MAGFAGALRLALQGPNLTGDVVTGHPTDNDNKQWDEKTRALVASLEALLEIHREQARDGGGSAPTGPTGAAAADSAGRPKSVADAGPAALDSRYPRKRA